MASYDVATFTTMRGIDLYGVMVDEIGRRKMKIEVVVVREASES